MGCECSESIGDNKYEVTNIEKSAAKSTGTASLQASQQKATIEPKVAPKVVVKAEPKQSSAFGVFAGMAPRAGGKGAVYFAHSKPA